MNKTVGTAIIALVIGVGVGYVGASILHPAALVQQSAPGGFVNGVRGSGAIGTRGGTAGGFLSGTVAVKNSESITVNTNDGNSHVVLVTPTTNISKSVSGSMNDISIGSTVIVSGTTNSDGSILAKLVQIRPAGTAQ